MYKLEKIIKDLKPDFFINEDGDILYSLKNENKLFFNDNVVYFGENFSFKLFNKSIFIIKTDEKILIHKDIKKSIKINAGFFIVDEFNVLFNIYSSDYSKQYYKLYNFIEEKEYWTIEKYFGVFIKEKNNLYASGIFDDNTIYKIDLNHPEKPIWQFDLNQLGTFKNNDDETKNYQVVKIMGIWQNELLVACSNGLLLSIDIQTGKENRKWQKIDNYFFDSEIQNKIPRAESFVLDGDNLIGALNKFIFKIDLKTSEITAFNIEQELSRYNIFHIKTVGNNPVTKNHFFLTAMMRQKEGDTKFSYDCIIVLNKNTLKIDWFYAFEEAGLGTNIPKLSGNKLYQLDNNNNLHIFEKQENETT